MPDGSEIPSTMHPRLKYQSESISLHVCGLWKGECNALEPVCMPCLLYKQWEGETRNASISTGSSGLLIPNY
jgi:hypothetical protein